MSPIRPKSRWEQGPLPHGVCRREPVPLTSLEAGIPGLVIPSAISKLPSSQLPFLTWLLLPPSPKDLCDYIGSPGVSLETPDISRSFIAKSSLPARNRAGSNIRKWTRLAESITLYHFPAFKHTPLRVYLFLHSFQCLLSSEKFVVQAKKTKAGSRIEGSVVSILVHDKELNFTPSR